MKYPGFPLWGGEEKDGAIFCPKREGEGWGEAGAGSTPTKRLDRGAPFIPSVAGEQPCS